MRRMRGNPLYETADLLQSGVTHTVDITNTKLPDGDFRSALPRFSPEAMRANQAFIAMSFGHIYIGTLGMEGAYQGMRTGYTDEEWLKEHHELWYEDVKAGRVPSQRSPVALTGSSPSTVQT